MVLQQEQPPDSAEFAVGVLKQHAFRSSTALYGPLEVFSTGDDTGSRGLREGDSRRKRNASYIILLLYVE